MSENSQNLIDALPKNYDHLDVEPRWVKTWNAWKIYEYNPDSPAAKAGRTFAIDTPPPYVSAAHLHTGHAMSYSQAEFVIRYKRMRGHEVFYPMGFDDNGLPTERYVEQKYKIQRGKMAGKDISRKEFIDLCLNETREGAAVYENLWRSLGLSVDWRMTYSTIQPRAVKHAQLSFLDLVKKGRLERREDPILWCPLCATSLAQADVEAGDEQNRPMHEVRFPVDPSTSTTVAEGIIETTRPELVTACVALACHPDDKRFGAMKTLRFQVPLTNLKYIGPNVSSDDGSFVGNGVVEETTQFRTVPLIFDESVDPEFGSGLMMVCTFGDTEDIAKWRNHKLETVLILDAQGRMITPDLPELNGKRVHVMAKGSSIYNEARFAAVELLKQYGYLLGVKDNTSRASLHERCSTPVEIQVAPQWFIRVLDLKEPLLQRGRELNWYPEFMRERYEQWVENLRWDWNISRQRFYGVPFPVWFCKHCETPNFAQEHELPIDPLMGDCPRPCSHCGGTELRPEPDVMDTWMTSSLTPLINANWATWNDPNGAALPIQDQPRPVIYPAGVRVQAHEIIRTWLFYTVAKAHLHTASLPWKDVMISGWGLDKSGKKMSKRLGNFVEPGEIIHKYSADALRYWAAGASLGNDLRFLEDDVKGGKRLLTKLWNSTRFAMMYLAGWTPGQVAETPTAADLGIRARVVEAALQATEAFEGYEYSKAVRAAETLFWSDWCDNYLEIVKDRFKEGSRFTPGEIEAARQTLLEGTWTMLRLFAPVLPFITEELYQLAIKGYFPNAPQSIHVADWPVDEAHACDVFGMPNPQLNLQASGWSTLLALVAAVRTARTAQKIGGGRQLLAVHLNATPDDRAQIEELLKDWLAAARADELLLDSRDGLEWHDVAGTSMKVAIVAAPQEPVA
jgi:valyl-tRNA synthetase